MKTVNLSLAQYLHDGAQERNSFWTADLFRFRLVSRQEIWLCSSDVPVRLRYLDVVLAAAPLDYWPLSYGATQNPSEVNHSESLFRWINNPTDGLGLTADTYPVSPGVCSLETAKVLNEATSKYGVATKTSQPGGGRPDRLRLDKAYTYEWLYRAVPPTISRETLLTNGYCFQAYRLKEGTTRFGHTAGGGEQVTDLGAFEFEDLSTYHIAVTFDGADLRVYVDGVLRASKLNVEEPFSSTDDGADLTFGAENGGSARVSGSLGHLAVYDYALSPEDIEFHSWASKNEVVFSPDFPVSRAQLRQSRGIEVDSLKLVLAPRDSDVLTIPGTIATIPVKTALVNGGFDGATVQVFRAMAPNAPRWPVESGGSWEAPSEDVLETPQGRAWPVGCISLFNGFVGEVNGNTLDFELEVRAATDRLDATLPRYKYTPGCVWELYGRGCGVERSTFIWTTTAAAGSKPHEIRGATVPNYGSGSTFYDLGRLRFLTGRNAFILRQVKVDSGGVYAVTPPFPYQVDVGDIFEIVPGCDKTLATCEAKFNNRSRFRGYPLVPPPETVIGVPVQEA